MVARFQSVISKEIKSQLTREIGNPFPDYVIACVGGGSNAAGAYYHFLDDEQVQLIGVEAAGHGVDSGESAATTVLGKIGVLRQQIPADAKRGRTSDRTLFNFCRTRLSRYRSLFILICFDVGRVRFMSATDDEAMNAGIELSRLEGIIPAIESAHAVSVINKLELDPDDVVVINLSGRGDKDLETYIKWGKY